MEEREGQPMRERRNTAEENHRLTGGIYGSSSGSDRFYALRPARDPISRSQSTESVMADTTLSPPTRYRDGMTIRAVTPESELDMELEGEGSEDSSVAPLTQPTSTPPRTPSRSTNRSVTRWDTLGRASPDRATSPEKSKSLVNRTSMSLSELSMSRAKSRSPTERMWRGGSPDDPASYVARQRYHTQAAGSLLACSVGFPSTQTQHSSPHSSQHSFSSKSSASNKPSRQRLLKPQSSAGALQTHTHSHPHIHTQPKQQTEPTSPVSGPDYATLIGLMQSTKGKMEGYAEYRVGENKIWSRGFCSINEERGSLMCRRDEHAPESPHTVISDLRGCEVSTASDNDGIVEIKTHFSKVDMKLRPLDVRQYESWLAALLCWTPIRPAGVQNKRVKPQIVELAQEKRDRRRKSDAALPRDAAIIKVGQMILWRPGSPNNASSTPSSGGSSKASGKIKGPQGAAWQDISCTLQENGEFRLYRQHDATLLTVVQLSQLSRCAVQQLDPSILDLDFCIAIYPQYTPASTRTSSARPVYLGVQTRIFFEVWFVLLRAFTMPELYGPAGVTTTPSPMLEIPSLELQTTTPRPDESLKDLYRIQRSLFLRVVEAKITWPLGNEREPFDCYAEVLLDQEVRAKTMVRTKTHNPFWREDYEFGDLPAVMTDVGVVLKHHDPRLRTKGSGSVSGSGGFGGGLGGVSVPGSRDTIVGRVDISLNTLTAGNCKAEGWFPLVDGVKGADEGKVVGEMFLKLELEELVVLMGSEYQSLSDLLHNFKSGLTMKLARVLSTDLRWLSDTLLKIFQVSNKTSDWLMSLAENEIDGLYRDAPISGSSSFREPQPMPNGSDHHDRTLSPSPQITKSTSRTGLVDANILFRGNSLLTKGLDAHMKRLGREYLEETLGPHLQKIAEEDTHCEVDPMRIESGDNLAKNWKTLMSITRAIWQAIYQSAKQCPIELRKILKHIRVCVEDRYGDLLRSVSYSSVCGFLFLRFFCPAILNPKLFGLLKDHPGVRAQRTLTLIAKSLQGLANMTTFGVKEPWMSPMNEFLSEHTSELKKFVDTVTSLTPAQLSQPPTVPPSYATPNTILSRLPPASKEGFPSLPYLIDQPRAFASLVSVWLKWHPNGPPFGPQSGPGSPPPTNPPADPDPDLLAFDRLCKRIKARMEECVAKAENAERPGSPMSARWEEVAEKVSGGGGHSMHASAGRRDDLTGLLGNRTVAYSTSAPGWESNGGAGQGRERSRLGGLVGGWRKMVKPGRLGEDEKLLPQP